MVTCCGTILDAFCFAWFHNITVSVGDTVTKNQSLCIDSFVKVLKLVWATWTANWARLWRQRYLRIKTNTVDIWTNATKKLHLFSLQWTQFKIQPFKIPFMIWEQESKIQIALWLYSREKLGNRWIHIVKNNKTLKFSKWSENQAAIKRSEPLA